MRALGSQYGDGAAKAAPRHRLRLAWELHGVQRGFTPDEWMNGRAGLCVRMSTGCGKSLKKGPAV